MSTNPFSKATKTQSRLRLALIGTSGSGKTYSALNIGQHLGQRMAVIDTERGSASKYASLFNFDVLELTDFAPQTYVAAIQAADAAGYDVLIIDSLTHAWSGKGGALEQVDAAAKRSPSGNSFTAWRDVTPKHNAMVDAILGCRAHVIATIRAKTEFLVEKDERGKSTPRKVGLAPIQRDGMEYEFDVVGDMDQSNTLIVSKSRCPALNGAMIEKPGEDVARVLKEWLTDGAPIPEPTPRPEPPVSHPIESTSHDKNDPGDDPFSTLALKDIRERLDANPGNFVPAPGEPSPLMVTSAEDELWISWCRLTAMARDEGVTAPTLNLPVRQEDLKEQGIALKDEIRRARQAQQTAGAR